MDDGDPMRVIISTDLSPYAEFVPLVQAAWDKLGFPCITVCAGGSTPDFEHVPLACPHGMPAGNLAMVSRMITASETPGISMLSDADMLPLSASYFKWLQSQVRPGVLLSASSDAYDKPGMHPICYLAADRATWKAIVNPDDLELRDLLESWRGRKLNEKDDPWKSPFCDESLLRWLLQRWGGEIDGRQRGWTGGIAEGRIDRARWKIRPGYLRFGGYIDAHMLRPFSENKGRIKPLADHLGLGEFCES